MDSSRKGKPINSSVPSIVIRFNANAEEIEEVVLNEEEKGDSVADLNQTSSSDVESSPIKLKRRSTSVDVSSDASPPTDPWRFFTDIKGKITKSVEGKLTEYKTRGGGEGADGSSPKAAKAKDPGGPKDGGGAGSSLSDSEDLSESSISKTCGIISTTEGVEMSSDDETPSLSDKDESSPVESAATSEKKKKIKIVKDLTVSSEAVASVGFLQNLQNINLGYEDDTKSDIESGVDALLQLDNVELDGEEVLIKEQTGIEIRNEYLEDKSWGKESTVFAPSGFVDLRPLPEEPTWTNFVQKYKVHLAVGIFLGLYLGLPLGPYICGFIAGMFLAASAALIYINLFTEPSISVGKRTPTPQAILQIPAVEEHQPPTKYEGWVNEYPEKYNAQTYHISQTQSVYLRLQGNLLKMSHTKQKIPKRAMWNEPEYKHSFMRHRIYNLLGAEVTLLPKGLTKIRHWSKKYPICVTLDKNQWNFDYEDKPKKTAETAEESKKVKSQSQLFSKLCDADLIGSNDFEDFANIDSSSTALVVDNTETSDADSIGEQNEDMMDCLTEKEGGSYSSNECLIQKNDGTQTCIYIFTRTSRDKEHWYKRLKEATVKKDGTEECAHKKSEQLRNEYLKLISKFTQLTPNLEVSNGSESAWLNALITRVMFDCMRNEELIGKIKERIQRKLSSIKLPYFIEELTITELSLGQTAPSIVKIEKPTTNDWGLWVDMDIQYEGQIVVILQTKLNLMRLKEPPQPCSGEKGSEKSPIYHSDVDDTAESSTDEDSSVQMAPSNVEVPEGNGGPSNKSKRIMKMVDRIAESKFFKAASENKFVKKAMEGVSKTDLRLKVELKSLSGCLAFNIPTPPSDRLWYGFRPSPSINLSAHPIVGERNINFNQVTNWIEKKLSKEFQKVLVFPNMEDIYIPVMLQWLTE
ncbi:PREDICTED: testis-expressed sequence 2 protein isoform X2 [Nicrophorus vespilloides]|uniref:Testis-expressed sequence 2 protein isoform X2 n=1 Tax=Nicrophorus vespilloides TaxID=110193 RepID=A0ABM1MJ90_NICVS|nr:PREDICTED: testis-expressed sequence 2 protein isoform X2 [Nicrophorus vespilloides]